MQSLCVYCGSSPGTRPEYREAARELARELVTRGLRLVYGGASVGLMGLLADTVLDAGGEVIGVIPEQLLEMEVGHAGLTELHVVTSMHARKALMAELSDGFVALPGGLGTYEELFEMLTWSQLRIHSKPIGALNVAGYYDGLVSMLDRGVREGFVRAESRAFLLVDTTPAGLLDQFARHA